MTRNLRDRSRWRRIWPRGGAPYELFDAAVFLLLLALIGYVFTDPPAASKQALSAPLDLLPPVVWGVALTGVATIGIIASYTRRWLRFGYLAMIVACTFWAANFAIGLVLYGAATRSLLSVLLYGWVASRLVRDIPTREEV